MERVLPGVSDTLLDRVSRIGSLRLIHIGQQGPERSTA